VREKYCHPAWTTHRQPGKREEKGREESDEMTQRGDDRKTLVFSFHPSDFGGTGRDLLSTHGD